MSRAFPHTHIAIFLCNPTRNLDHTVAAIVLIQNRHLEVCVKGVREMM